MVTEKQCRRCGLTKAAKEFRQDSRYRDGIGSWCSECHRQRNSEWAKENRARLTAKTAKWRSENADIWEKTYRRSARKHRKVRALKHAEWARSNRDKRNASGAKRKAAKLRATPSWADLDAIYKIYAEGARVTDETGIPHHVDHIVPLQHRRVCGLHIAANLRVITASENVRKKNRLIEPPAKLKQESML